MPMPIPKTDETKEEFVARFMKDEAMISEYPDQKQRLAVAYSKWEQDHKCLCGCEDRVITFKHNGKEFSYRAHDLEGKKKLLGNMMARRILGSGGKSGIHCPQCVELADYGWMPAMLMPPLGDTYCKTNCTCEIEYSDGIPKKLGDNMEPKYKAFELKSIDDQYLIGTASMDTADTENDTMNIDGMDYSDYHNPAQGKYLSILLDHENKVEKIVGKVESFATVQDEAGNKSLQFKMKWADTELTKAIKPLVPEFVNSFSVGFIPVEADKKAGGGYNIKKSKLFEISLVAIPAHPDARAMAAVSKALAPFNKSANPLEDMVTRCHKEQMDCHDTTHKEFPKLVAKMEEMIKEFPKLEAKMKELMAENTVAQEKHMKGLNVRLDALESILDVGTEAAPATNIPKVETKELDEAKARMGKLLKTLS